MSKLLEIQSEITGLHSKIAELQRQAEEIKAQEVAGVVEEIKTKMATYGITVADLAGSVSRKKKPATKIGTAPVKFRGPNGETWSGRGLMPRWLSALVATGKTRENYAVEA